MIGTTSVAIRSSSLDRIAPVDDYVSLELRPTFNDVGTWELVLPSSAPAALATTFLGGISAFRREAVLLSGPPRRIGVDHDGKHERTVLSGVCDNHLLVRRVVHPSPLDGNPATAEYDTFTGPAEDALHYYVARNLGPSALAGRRDVRLAMGASGSRGGIGTWNGRWQNLLEFCQEIAKGRGLGFRIVQSAGQLHFQTYVPSDRSATVVFGFDRHNLLSYSFQTDAPDATDLYVLGQGEGAARMVTLRSNPTDAAAFGRHEDTHDQRHIETLQGLEQSGDASLAERGASSGLTVAPVDDNNQMYGSHYFLGDRVSARLPGGFGVTDTVRQVVVKLDVDGEVVRPVVASEDVTLHRIRLIDTLRRLGRRVTNLEVA